MSIIKVYCWAVFFYQPPSRTSRWVRPQQSSTLSPYFLPQLGLFQHTFFSCKNVANNFHRTFIYKQIIVRHKVGGFGIIS